MIDGFLFSPDLYSTFDDVDTNNDNEIDLEEWEEWLGVYEEDESESEDESEEETDDEEETEVELEEETEVELEEET